MLKRLNFPPTNEMTKIFMFFKTILFYAERKRIYTSVLIQRQIERERKKVLQKFSHLPGLIELL